MEIFLLSVNSVVLGVLYQNLLGHTAILSELRLKVLNLEALVKGRRVDDELT